MAEVSFRTGLRGDVVGVVTGLSTGHNLQSPWEESLQEGLSTPGWACLTGTVLIKLIDGTHSGQHIPYVWGGGS